MNRKPVKPRPSKKPAAPAEPLILGAETMVSPRDAVDLAEYNPRTQTTESADRLRNSLAAFGLADLPVVNRRSMAQGWPKGSRPCLVGGHQRLRILDAKHGQAYQFRHTVVDLDAPMEKALNIALNNLDIQGEYAVDRLAPILMELNAISGFNIEVTGFTMPKIEDICIDAGLMEMPVAGGGAMAEWTGMPEFGNTEKAIKTLYVHFETEEAIAKFAKLIGQDIGMKTKYVWYPEKKRQDLKSKVYKSES